MSVYIDLVEPIDRCVESITAYLADRCGDDNGTVVVNLGKTAGLDFSQSFRNSQSPLVIKVVSVYKHPGPRPVHHIILERIAETGIVDPQYKELGMEALHLIKVDRYPAIIGAAHGRSIYEK